MRSATMQELARIAAAVENGEHNDVIAVFAKMEGVRKNLNDGAAFHFSPAWKLRGIFEDAFDRFLHFAEEPFVEPSFARVVPSDAVIQFTLRHCANDEPSAHSLNPYFCSSSALTVSQGTASSGCARWSCHRRSNSASSSGVISGSYPSLTNDDQISFINSMRVPTGRRLACSKIAAGSSSLVGSRVFVAMSRACRRFGKIASSRAGLRRSTEIQNERVILSGAEAERRAQRSRRISRHYGQHRIGSPGSFDCVPSRLRPRRNSAQDDTRFGLGARSELRAR